MGMFDEGVSMFYLVRGNFGDSILIEHVEEYIDQLLSVEQTEHIERIASLAVVRSPLTCLSFENTSFFILVPLPFLLSLRLLLSLSHKRRLSENAVSTLATRKSACAVQVSSLMRLPIFICIWS